MMVPSRLSLRLPSLARSLSTLRVTTEGGLRTITLNRLVTLTLTLTLYKIVPLPLCIRYVFRLSVCPDICLSFCPNASRAVCFLLFFVSVCLSADVFICLSICQSICLSDFLFPINLSVCLSVPLYVYLSAMSGSSVKMSLCPNVHLSRCLSV